MLLIIVLLQAIAMLGICVFINFDRKRLVAKYEAQLFEANTKATDLQSEIDERDRCHNEQLVKIRKYSEQIEAVAMAFNDMNLSGAGMIKIMRQDPDRIFEWQPRR